MAVSIAVAALQSRAIANKRLALRRRDRPILAPIHGLCPLSGTAASPQLIRTVTLDASVIGLVTPGQAKIVIKDFCAPTVT